MRVNINRCPLTRQPDLHWRVDGLPQSAGGTTLDLTFSLEGEPCTATVTVTGSATSTAASTAAGPAVGVAYVLPGTYGMGVTPCFCVMKIH